MVNRLRHIHIYIRDGLLDLMAALPDVAVNNEILNKETQHESV